MSGRWNRTNGLEEAPKINDEILGTAGHILWSNKLARDAKRSAENHLGEAWKSFLKVVRRSKRAQLGLPLSRVSQGSILVLL